MLKKHMKQGNRKTVVMSQKTTPMAAGAAPEQLLLEVAVMALSEFWALPKRSKSTRRIHGR
jgi:hypothetical protein